MQLQEVGMLQRKFNQWQNFVRFSKNKCSACLMFVGGCIFFIINLLRINLTVLRGLTCICNIATSWRRRFDDKFHLLFVPVFLPAHLSGQTTTSVTWCTFLWQRHTAEQKCLCKWKRYIFFSSIYLRNLEGYSVWQLNTKYKSRGTWKLCRNIEKYHLNPSQFWSHWKILPTEQELIWRDYNFSNSDTYQPWFSTSIFPEGCRNVAFATSGQNTESTSTF